MVNVPWCHDCDNPLGLCSCEADPDQDFRDYHHGVVAELQKTLAAKDAAIERLLAEVKTEHALFLIEAEKHSEWLEKYMGMKAERDRLERNRDMWKGQCERQADELTRARQALQDTKP